MTFSFKLFWNNSAFLFYCLLIKCVIYVGVCVQEIAQFVVIITDVLDIRT